MCDPQLTKLPRLPAEFLRATGRHGPTYGQCHSAAVNALIPVQFIAGRWYYRASDLPEIVSYFGGEIIPAEAQLVAA